MGRVEFVNVYVLYRDDEVVGIGTAEELSERFGIKPETVRFYASHAQHSRNRAMVAERVKVKREDFL
jgi:hypothetical protein